MIDDALSRVNRSGELPSLVLLHATPGIEETLIESIDNKFGSQVPIIGGSAADNYLIKTGQYSQNKVQPTKELLCS